MRGLLESALGPDEEAPVRRPGETKFVGQDLERCARRSGRRVFYRACITWLTGTTNVFAVLSMYICRATNIAAANTRTSIALASWDNSFIPIEIGAAI